jgi:hypothetical protein
MFDCHWANFRETEAFLINSVHNSSKIFNQNLANGLIIDTKSQ